MAMQRVREAAEKAKIELSTVIETDIIYLHYSNKVYKALSNENKQSKLEDRISNSKNVKNQFSSIADAKLTATDLIK